MRRIYERICGCILICVMLLAIQLPVHAISVAPSGQLIVRPAEEGASYEMYPILYSEEPEGADSGEDETPIYYNTVNPEYEGALNKVVPAGEQAHIPAYISGLSGSDLQRFAQSLYREIRKEGIRPIETATASGGEAAFSEWSETGYYMVVQTQAPDNEAFSVVMMDTIRAFKTVYVSPKTDTPVVEKKVMEGYGGEAVGDSQTGVWQDAADYGIGDTVPFRITATYPANFNLYDSYSVRFHDTLDAGMTYNDDVHVYTIDQNDEESQIDVTENFVIEKTGNELVVSIDNLLDNETLFHSKSLIITYTATLHDGAKIGQEGNANKVYMEYSRNPQGNEMGKTPEDKVQVFTYRVKVKKVDEKKEPLSGAQFGLYKLNPKTGAYDKVKETTEPGTEFAFSGLDAGSYRLQELQAPEGYYRMEPIEFVIEAEYDVLSADPKLRLILAKKPDGESITGGAGGTFSVLEDGGTLLTTVVNYPGSELPSTGGRGTTLLYISGAALILCGAAGYVWRRRSRVGNGRS